MDLSFYLIVAAAFFGFVGLAFALLYPVYRFLHKETKISEEWTPEALAARRRQALQDGTEGGDGASAQAGTRARPPSLRPSPPEPPRPGEP